MKWSIKETSENCTEIRANLSILSTYFHQKYFCDVTSHVWNASCRETGRKKFLEIKYPEMCDIIAPYSEFFDEEASCDDWPKNFFAKNRYVQETLIFLERF